jgi:4-aminobutyrate aminotransferase-like enzyme
VLCACSVRFSRPANNDIFFYWSCIYTQVVFFTNSGTEANELAILMSRLYTGSHDIISLRNSYHGNAAGTMGATAQKNWKFNVIQVHTHKQLTPCMRM